MGNVELNASKSVEIAHFAQIMSVNFGMPYTLEPVLNTIDVVVCEA